MHKHSPVYTHHMTHGATMAERAGWLVPERYTFPEQESAALRDSVGLIDRSDVGKIELNGKGLTPWSSGVYKTEVMPQQTAYLTVADGVTGLCCWLRRDQGLMIVPADATDAALAALADGREERLHITDVTSVYCALQLLGPRSLDVLHRITPLDVRPSRLPSGACVQGSAMKVSVLLIRDDLAGLPAFWLLVPRSYGEFVWKAVCNAGEDFGLHAIGYRAYQTLDT